MVWCATAGGLWGAPERTEPVGHDWDEISRTAVLARESGSASEARTVVRSACREACVPPAITDTAVLLTSELVTNAFIHGGGETVVLLDICHDHLRISVADAHPGVPEVKKDNPVLAINGRGLLLVDTLAARWGVDGQWSSGKSVWFEIDNT
jgi:anti-sigma regulatory factor (Ser/Thr protein kinase)